MRAQLKERTALLDSFQLFADQAGVRVTFVGGALGGMSALSRLQTCMPGAMTPSNAQQQADDPTGMYQLAAGPSVCPPLPPAVAKHVATALAYERVCFLVSRRTCMTLSKAHNSRRTV